MKKSFLLAVVLLVAACAQAQNASPLTSFAFTQITDAPTPCTNGNRGNGVNQRGDIVGRCKDSSGNPHSWVMPRSATAPTLLDFSSAPFVPTLGSTTRAIDSSGDIVGRYFDSAGVTHGYLLNNGVFSSIDVPFSGALGTDARGLNNSGTIVGFYGVPTFVQNVGILLISHGFILTKGTFTSIDVPGAAATAAIGINDVGDVVGWYVVVTNATTVPPAIAVHGFLLSHGVYTTIDVQGATATQAWGINEQGEIAGSFTTFPVTLGDLTKDDPTVPTNGFMRSADGTTFTQIDFPNSISTDCRGGINDHGNLVGAFTDTSLTEHAFVTSKQ